MEKKTNRICLALLLMFSYLGYAQDIISTILDQSTKQPLESVSIYYDGTTLGTVSNSKGQFVLSTEFETQAAIVISYLGYETRYFTREELAKLKTIYLQESTENLDAVVLEYDPWSRKKKLEIFRKEFLGRDTSADRCKILNEKEITLIYQPSKERLTAYCDEPIIIKNQFLGYEIKYNLVDFEVQFNRGTSDFRFTESVYMVGSTAFTELKNKPKKRFLKARKASYLGSYLQFMRALKRKDLAAQKFQCFVEDSTKNSKFFLPVNPYNYLLVKNQDSSLTEVTMNFKKLVVQYDQNKQSALIPRKETETFYIDQFGIHSPPTALYFSGNFGIKRVANLLPLNYRMEKD